MHRLVLTIAAVVVWTATAYADPPAPDLDTVCAQSGCRTGGFDIAIAVDAQRYTTIPVSRSPYVPDDKSVLIFPGETIAIQFTPDGDSLTHPKFIGRYAPEMAAQIESGDVLSANPDDAKLPKLKGEIARDQMADMPPNTLLISYGQLDPHSGGMMLKTEHNFARPLKFTAILAIIRKGTYEQRPTSTCAVLPGIFGTEMWPDLLGPLVLTDLRLIDLPQTAGGGVTINCN